MGKKSKSKKHKLKTKTVYGLEVALVVLDLKILINYFNKLLLHYSQKERAQHNKKHMKTIKSKIMLWNLHFLIRKLPKTSLLCLKCLRSWNLHLNHFSKLLARRKRARCLKINKTISLVSPME